MRWVFGLFYPVEGHGKERTFLKESSLEAHTVTSREVMIMECTIIEHMVNVVLSICKANVKLHALMQHE